MAVYDYGDGRTYATPQEAFDACQAANEVNGVPQAFTEPNYIRGYGRAVFGNAQAGEPVLRLVHSVSGRGVRPTQGNRLVIDQNPGDQVEFADSEGAGCIVGGAADGTELASHVTVDLPALHSLQGEMGAGVIVCPDRTGGETAVDWVIRNCRIHALDYGIVLGSLRSGRIEAVEFLGYGGTALVYADGSEGDYGALQGHLVLLNCTARAEGPVLDLSGDFSLTLMQCSVYSAEDHVLRLSPEGGGMDLIVANSILVTSAEERACLSLAGTDWRVLYSDGNCYFSPGLGAGVLEQDGEILSLPEFQARYGQDANSLSADPRMLDPANGDFRLHEMSPCRMRGRTAPPAGLEGNERAISIDIGAYQHSLPANWNISAQAGEISARIEGRIRVQGL